MKTFVVLGMHRSATSLVSKALNNEVEMHADMRCAASDNPQGHWEDTEFISLNSKILQIAGGSWDTPPKREDILRMKDIFESDIIELIEKRNDEGLNWGWKDPRTCLTIWLYHEYLKKPHYVVCFRDPIEVAHSLFKRNGIPINRGVELANHYNKEIIDFISQAYNVKR